MITETSIYNCCVIQLAKIHDRAGNMTVIEETELPFRTERIYYLYDVPSGSERGGHAHHVMQHLIVAASGSFDVLLDDGESKKVVTLNRPNFGLYVPQLIWVELLNFSSGAIALNLVSTKYDETDYIREYDKFVNLKSVLPCHKIKQSCIKHYTNDTSTDGTKHSSDF